MLDLFALGCSDAAAAQDGLEARLSPVPNGENDDLLTVEAIEDDVSALSELH